MTIEFIPDNNNTTLHALTWLTHRQDELYQTDCSPHATVQCTRTYILSRAVRTALNQIGARREFIATTRKHKLHYFGQTIRTQYTHF